MTGIFSDDFIMIDNIRRTPFTKLLLPDLKHIHVLVFSIPSYYLDTLQYYFFNIKYLLFYDIIKISFSLISGYLIFTFFRSFFSINNSILLSVFFVFFPLHDSINYWPMALAYLIIPSLILFAYILVNQEKYTSGIIIGILGCFMSYASPPYIFGLSVLFLIEKKIKKFIIFILPQLLYILYYFSVHFFLNIKGRVNSSLSLTDFFKQVILQIGTFLDVAMGPSLWLKIYYSFYQLTFSSIIIGIILTIIFYKYYEPQHEKINYKLLIVFLAITFLSFCMFALTGYYPQISFNLGNRVTIYGSLLLSYIIVMFLMQKNKTVATIIFAIFVFSVLGISDHWKKWNKNQQHIMANISKNIEIKNFPKDKHLFVTYNQYSRFGKMSHIEFLVLPDAIHAIFELSTGKKFRNISPLNNFYYYNKNTHEIIDKKFGTKFKVKDYIFVYDSQKDKLLKIQEKSVSAYIKSLPIEYRHWIQLLPNDNFIKKIILILMPRLKYAF